MQDPHDPVAAIQEFRAQFVRGAEKRLAIIEAKIARLQEAPSDRGALDALRMELHAFSGLGGTYGFRKVSKLGHEGEVLCDRLAKAKGAASPEDLSAWAGLAASIRKELGLEGVTARPRVLAVTGDSGRASALESILEMAGYDVRIAAPPGWEAAASDFRPELLLFESASDAARAGAAPWLLLGADLEPGPLLAAIGERLERARGGG